MDSISQFALGAAVGVAVMGRRTAPWKAALWGGICGTLPDLDALIDHGDPVRNMTLHRTESHALFWQTLAAPPIAACVAAFDRGPGQSLRAAFPRRLLAVWLTLVTHALLDAMTVYGTQLALPFTDEPFAVGSIFIIDPLYTLPLLLGLGIALSGERWRRLRWNLAGLALSTAYLGWSFAAQQYVAGTVRAQLAAAPGADAVERMLVTPAPFTTLLWRVVLMRGDRYEEGFHSLLNGGRPIRFTSHPSGRALYEESRSLAAVARMAWFSHGFFAMSEHDGRLRITDLRMGQEPYYSFSFAVAQRGSAPAPITPVSVGGREGLNMRAALGWLWRRTGGEDLDPPR